MAYAHVDNDTITDRSSQPPRSGTLPAGSKVSNLHHADAEVMASAGWLPVTDDTQPTYDPDTQRVIAAPLSDWQVRDSDVLRTWVVEDRPTPPDTDGLLLAAFAPTADGGLGEDRAIALVQARPDLQIALDRENWKVARGAVDRALQQGVIDQGEYDTLQGLFATFNIPVT